MITLRLLGKEDAAIFRELRLQGLKESPESFGASFSQEEAMPLGFFEQRIESTPDKWVIGAFEHDVLAGVIGFVRDTGDKSRHKGFVWGMYVAPGLREKGIGSALIKEAMARAGQLAGLRRIRLSVGTLNLSALRLYERFGFILYGEEPEALCVDGRFYSEYHMAWEVKAK